jgi:ABC-2 type transport system permease protein
MNTTSERLTPARLRKPSLLEATLHGGWTLFWESFKKYGATKRSLVLSLLFLAPSAIIILARSLGGMDGPNESEEHLGAERSVILTFLPTALLSFAALLNAAGLIQDEIEEQTLTYLLMRPTPRWMIYLAKLAAAALGTIIIASVFFVVSYLSLYAGTPYADRIPKSIPPALGPLALTAAAYTAVFGLIGLLLRRSLVIGVVYIVLFEGILAVVPFNFRNYTVVYHFRVMCHHWVGVPADFWGLPENPTDMPTAGSSVLALLAAFVVFATLGALYMQFKEFRMKTPAGA